MSHASGNERLLTNVADKTEYYIHGDTLTMGTWNWRLGRVTSQGEDEKQQATVTRIPNRMRMLTVGSCGQNVTCRCERTTLRVFGDCECLNEIPDVEVLMLHQGSRMPH